jgi:hypothetical protein
MKKLLGIKDSEEFWKVFSKEREKIRKKRRNLPFSKKIEILSSIQKLFPKNR